MLKRILKPRTEQAYALLRFFSGALFAFHGMQKVFGILGRTASPLLSQMGLGGLIELVCGLAIAAGVATRSAAFLSSGTMAVAYAQFHWKLQGGAEFFPAINEGELAVVYAFVFLFIACKGAGAWSLKPD
jgi:putative oxidoreductase